MNCGEISRPATYPRCRRRKLQKGMRILQTLENIWQGLWCWALPNSVRDGKMFDRQVRLRGASLRSALQGRKMCATLRYVIVRRGMW
jgi:hypothetical protein